MHIFQREIETQIVQKLTGKGMVIILGPRQSGKTTLSKKLLDPYGKNGGYFNCEHSDVRKHFKLGETAGLLELIGSKKIVVFDEAQTIQNIGKILKLFYDTYPDIKIIATGSSSFDLANKIKEPMTGRAYEFTLYPLSLTEIAKERHIDRDDLADILEYGTYPAVLNAPSKEDRAAELRIIATNYLYKDVFTFETIRNPKAFEDLLTHLAVRAGNTISTNDLSREIGVSQVSVEKYLRLLEQSYVIKRVYSFARNWANELKKSYKIYFIDVGVRNMLAGTLGGLVSDTEKGVMFENFAFSEFLKKDTLVPFPPKTYFWRTRNKLEIDFVRVSGNTIAAYEVKLSSQAVPFKTFLKYYPEATTSVLSPESLLLDT